MATNEMEQILNRIAAGFSARPWDFRKRLLELLPMLEAGQDYRDRVIRHKLGAISVTGKPLHVLRKNWDAAKAALLANRKGG